MWHNQQRMFGRTMADEENVLEMLCLVALEVEELHTAAFNLCHTVGTLLYQHVPPRKAAEN